MGGFLLILSCYNFCMQKVRVGVIRGGPSNEYDISLLTGESVIKNIPSDKYNVEDILIDKEGGWHRRGLTIDHNMLFTHVDVIFNALHGEYGEDGRVQKVLEDIKIPYTGSGVLESAICMNKVRAKNALKDTGIKMARHTVVAREERHDDLWKKIHNKFGAPYVVKPMSGGSSVGVTIARNPQKLKEGLEKAFNISDELIVEEYICGREATCGVMDDFRDKEYYTLLPIEIIPDEGKSLFDYEAKYHGKSQELCPGNFTNEESMDLQKLAKLVHETLKLSHYSRSDFIISPYGIYFLEVNTLPGLTDGSLVPKSLKALGINFPDFLDHVLQLAMKR